MTKYKLDLADWKAVEQQAEQDINACNKTLALQTMMLEIAHRAIKKLGGLTSEEEAEQEKKNHEAG